MLVYHPIEKYLALEYGTVQTNFEYREMNPLKFTWDVDSGFVLGMETSYIV
jgi:hypothetical protein